MSYMKCRRLSERGGKITINITENNVSPAMWRDYTMKGDGRGALISMIWNNEIQLQGRAKLGLGGKIEDAIERVGGRRWYGCDDITKEEEAEMLSKVEALAFGKARSVEVL